MREEPYRQLAEHLDRLPDGFAPSDTGADLRLLQRLFGPEGAGLATHLALVRKPRSEWVQPPSTFEATWRVIAPAQAGI